MRFCMVSTFYPPYHFGGDALYVHRLANALARRDHEVDVIHDRDAYHLTQRDEPPHTFDEHPNIRVHRMKSAFGALSPFATQQTGRPWFKSAVRRHLTSGRYDVVHFHNISLIGSAALRYGSAVKLYTMHEHWLICPMHVLWKFDREACDSPECLTCCLQGRRPPQLWRYTGRLERDLSYVDRFLAPSRFTRDRHEQAGLRLPVTVLPFFAPPVGSPDRAPSHPRPYFLFVGRLVKLKGVDTLIRAFRQYPEADLLIAGDGEEATALQAAAADLPNVRFLGAVHPPQLTGLYRDAIALIMPSVGYETFGMVLVEALAVGTPVIVRDLGGMPEVVEDSQAGIVFRTDEDLLAAMRKLQGSPQLRRDMGVVGQRVCIEKWSEDAHVDQYLSLVGEEMERRRPSLARATVVHS